MKLWSVIGKDGFEIKQFEFEGKSSVLVFPQEGNANGRLAIKTEYWDAFPEAIELELLQAGFHLCYVENNNRWGTDPDLDRKARFVHNLCTQYHLNLKTVPVGMSCGGLIAIKFAAKYPELVACLYLDAPVLNYMSCPCGFGVGTALDGDPLVREILAALEMESISELICYREMPMDKISQLVEAKIPVDMVVGGVDTTVPYCENGILLQRAYEKAGIPIQIYIKPNCDHHPHGWYDPKEVMQSILQHL